MSNKKMPLQPIENGRFVPNRIVQHLLDTASIDMNDIARMDFSDDERMQFAQLIGYSLSGFGELSYTDIETYEAALQSSAGMSEQEARIAVMRKQLEAAKRGVRDAALALFSVHPDDMV